MENTGKMLFEGDTDASWVVAVGDDFLGPLTAFDVYEKIQAGAISWAHYVWKEGQPQWERACDSDAFHSLAPKAPGSQAIAKARSRLGPRESLHESGAKKQGSKASGAQVASAKLASESNERIWFLYYNDSQFGPFSFDEVDRYLRIGKIHGRVYAWRDGLPTWEKLDKLVLFDEAVVEGKKQREKVKAEASAAATTAVQVSVQTRVKSTHSERTGTGTALSALQGQSPTGSESGISPEALRAPAYAIERRAEQRLAPRRPLIARLLMTDEASADVRVAICRDVSVGGMQVLTDQIPGPVGLRIKLNVSPAGNDRSFRPFVAQGLIVRILEDGRGFSFRFDKLRGDARRSIEEYVEESRPVEISET